MSKGDGGGAPPDFDWPDASLQYAGWIPCITGHLSFSAIGKTAGLRGAAVYNEFDPTSRRRYLIVIEKRYARDNPLPHRVDELRTRSVAQNYIIVARSHSARYPVWEPQMPGSRSKTLQSPEDEQGALEGFVVMLPPQKSRELRKSAKNLVQQVRGEVAAANRALRRERNVFQSLSPENRYSPASVYDRLARAIGSRLDNEEVVAFRCGVRLIRTGEVRFWYREPPERPYLDLQRLSLAQAPAGLDERVVRRVGAKQIAEQMYYFVKDAAHRHYHHNPDADRITPLVLSGPNDDVAWRRETLWSLARSILFVRREDDVWGYKRALGMIGYAEVFQRTLAGVVRDPADFQHFSVSDLVADYQWHETRASLGALHDEHIGQRTTRAILLGGALTIFVSATALWVGALETVISACNRSLEVGAGAMSEAESANSDLGSTPETGAATPGPTAALYPNCENLPVLPRWATKVTNYLLAYPSRVMALAMLLSWVVFEHYIGGLRQIRLFRRVFGSTRSMFEGVGIFVSTLFSGAMSGIASLIGYGFTLIIVSLWLILLSWAVYVLLF